MCSSLSGIAKKFVFPFQVTFNCTKGEIRYQSTRKASPVIKLAYFSFPDRDVYCLESGELKIESKINRDTSETILVRFN